MPIPMNIPRRAIAFKQLAAIAARVLATNAAISEADWREGIKETCAKQGWDSPDPSLLTRAMDAANHVYKKTHGRRPIPEPQPDPAPAAEQPYIPISREEAITVLARLGARLKTMPTPERAIDPHRLRLAVQIHGEIDASLQRCKDLERAVKRDPEEI